MMIIVYKNKEQIGPFSAEQVQEYVDKGYFNLSDYCWAEGWSEWRIIATFASKLPNFKKDTLGNTCNDSIPQTNIDLASKEINSVLLNGSDSINDKSKQFSGFFQKVGAIDSQRLTSMASLGFFGPETLASKKEDSSPKDLSEKIVHLARAGEIFDKCRISEIPNKIASGHLNSNDLWFNETKSRWEPLSELRG